MLPLNSSTKKFVLPKEIEPYFDYLYTEEEKKLLKVLDEKMLTAEEISKEIGYDCTELIKTAYKKDIVSKEIIDGVLKYNLYAITTRVNNFAVYEQETYRSMPKEGREALRLFHLDYYLKKKQGQTLEELSQNKNRISTTEEAIAYLKSVTEPIIVIPCDCRSKAGGCGHSKNTCIMVGSGLNTVHDKGLGTILTNEEAIELIKECAKEGLMHSLEAEGMCNCCGDCCYPLTASKAMGLKGIWPQQSKIINFDESKCIKCGKCIKRCHFGVFEKVGGSILLDREKCYGCGVCVSTCPKEALSLSRL